VRRLVGISARVTASLALGVAACRGSRPDFGADGPSGVAGEVAQADGQLAPPRTYRCERAGEPPELEGTFEEGAWHKAPWTEDFVVVRRRGPAGSVRTRAKMLWDDAYLYCAVELLEPQQPPEPGAPPPRHDVDLMVTDEPQHGGYQVELVGMGTIVDAWFDGSGTTRDGQLKWDAKGLRTSVQKVGDGATLRWTAAFALPWSSLSPLGRTPRADAVAPQPGAVWRVDMGRTTWRPLAATEGAPPEPTAFERAAWQPPADATEPRGWGEVEFAP
jgi:hypothetical protein